MIIANNGLHKTAIADKKINIKTAATAIPLYQQQSLQFNKRRGWS